MQKIDFSGDYDKLEKSKNMKLYICTYVFAGARSYTFSNEGEDFESFKNRVKSNPYYKGYDFVRFFEAKEVW